MMCLSVVLGHFPIHSTPILLDWERDINNHYIKMKAPLPSPAIRLVYLTLAALLFPSAHHSLIQMSKTGDWKRMMPDAFCIGLWVIPGSY